ncbi:MAG TPA: hypothetical protein VKA67_00340, partial [Verrucomicrobiae bacterium]|nr:hypothetical protein [Verrucomicrobiae bacterium]
DDLQSIANDYLQQRKEEVARCEAIIRQKVSALLAGLRLTGRDQVPARVSCSVLRDVQPKGSA